MNAVIETVIMRFDSLKSFDNSYEIINRYQNTLVTLFVFDENAFAATIWGRGWHRINVFKNRVHHLPVADLLPLEADSKIIYKDIVSTNQWKRYPFPLHCRYHTFILPSAFEGVGLYDLAWRVQMEIGQYRYNEDKHLNDGNSSSYYLSAEQS